VIGDREESLCDCCLCEKGMLLDDGVTGDRNSKLRGSEPREDPTFSRDFGTIPNGISVPVDLESFTEATG
jgi:hypothetical protein